MGDLIGRWCAAARGAGAGASADAIETAGRRLLARWSEPHRRYHTVAHLTAVLDHVDAAATQAERPDLVRLAAWWHDAVYDPRALGDDNERASAALAGRELTELGVPETAVAEVGRLVLLTADHAAADADSDAALLCDADLAVLAAAPAEYDRYAAAIRLEYAHVDDAAFRAGRAAVLRRLAALPALYRLAHLPPDQRRSVRERARANLRRELAALTGERPTGRG